MKLRQLRTLLVLSVFVGASIATSSAPLSLTIDNLSAEHQDDDTVEVSFEVSYDDGDGQSLQIVDENNQPTDLCFLVDFEDEVECDQTVPCLESFLQDEVCTSGEVGPDPTTVTLVSSEPIEDLTNRWVTVTVDPDLSYEGSAAGGSGMIDAEATLELDGE
ncbi:MAG: hypothetical protein QGG40_08880 [Myxococcota bacterium]|nr:hypothetical protein [Myxococcota bacterium]